MTGLREQQLLRCMSTHTIQDGDPMYEAARAEIHSAGYREGAEAACRAVCPFCVDADPAVFESGIWGHPIQWQQCKASAIRALMEKGEQDV